jgi:hypothetical protein
VPCLNVVISVLALMNFVGEKNLIKNFFSRSS